MLTDAVIKFSTFSGQIFFLFKKKETINKKNKNSNQQKKKEDMKNNIFVGFHKLNKIAGVVFKVTLSRGVQNSIERGWIFVSIQTEADDITKYTTQI